MVHSTDKRQKSQEQGNNSDSIDPESKWSCRPCWWRSSGWDWARLSWFRRRKRWRSQSQTFYGTSGPLIVSLEMRTIKEPQCEAGRRRISGFLNSLCQPIPRKARERAFLVVLTPKMMPFTTISQTNVNQCCQRNVVDSQPTWKCLWLMMAQWHSGCRFRLKGISMFKLITPTTENQLNKYYHFRWQMLREPWRMPVQSAMNMTRDESPSHDCWWSRSSDGDWSSAYHPDLEGQIRQVWR